MLKRKGHHWFYLQLHLQPSGLPLAKVELDSHGGPREGSVPFLIWRGGKEKAWKEKPTTNYNICDSQNYSRTSRCCYLLSIYSVPSSGLKSLPLSLHLTPLASDGVLSSTLLGYSLNKHLVSVMCQLFFLTLRCLIEQRCTNPSLAVGCKLLGGTINKMNSRDVSFY